MKRYLASHVRTDINDKVLEQAQKGIYPAKDIKQSTQNYQKAGGKNSFASYFHADYDSVIMDRSLKKNIVFANHNLANDSTFGEMNIIFCRRELVKKIVTQNLPPSS